MALIDKIKYLENKMDFSNIKANTTLRLENIFLDHKYLWERFNIDTSKHISFLHDN